jgi:hypothetical protein
MRGSPTPRVTDFDYHAPADFYGWKSQGRGKGVVTFRRFSSGAEAVRHAIEDVSSGALGRCVVEVNGQRFHGNDIRILYASHRFPLRRAMPT